MKETDPEIKNVPSTGRYTQLGYLEHITDGNRESMAQMITIYLEQTPLFINAMKEGINKMDWEAVHKAVHSLIPSFSVMGISDQYEKIARTIQDNAIKKENPEQTEILIDQLSEVCNKACEELKVELYSLKLK